MCGSQVREFMEKIQQINQTTEIFHLNYEW